MNIFTLFLMWHLMLRNNFFFGLGILETNLIVCAHTCVGGAFFTLLALGPRALYLVSKHCTTKLLSFSPAKFINSLSGIFVFSVSSQFYKTLIENQQNLVVVSTQISSSRILFVDGNTWRFLIAYASDCGAANWNLIS